MVFRAFVFVFVFGSGVASASPGPLPRTAYGSVTVSDCTTAFTAQALDAAKSTCPVKVLGFNQMVVVVDYTYDAATKVMLSCYEKVKGSTVYAEISMCDDATPPYRDCDLTIIRWTPAAADHTYRAMLPTIGEYFFCTVSATGGSSSDTATVEIIGGVQ